MNHKARPPRGTTPMMTRHRLHGFTLIELMIVVAIVAIIAAIALPSWRRSVMKSDRSDAQVALNQDAQILERCYTQYGAYNNTSCPALATTSPQNFYSVSATASTWTFTITATAIGTQQQDTGCTSMTLDNTGNRNPSSCWEK